MRFILPTLLALCALVSARCGAELNKHIEGLHVAYRAHEGATASQPTRRQAASSRKINTYIHVIINNGTLAGGNVTKSVINQQMDVLNSGFNGTGFSFILINTTYSLKPVWREIVPQSATEYSMKSSLRRGNYSDLNIYIDTIAPYKGDTILGYATFPDKASQRTFDTDGVVVDPTVLPGVEDSAYNKGITLVHEVGHWMSLLHTFQPSNATISETAGCYGNGDYIYDTPAEGYPAFGCQKNRDTCSDSLRKNNPTSELGSDPTSNYMDYSDDSCLTTFTAGQIKRMTTSYVNTRLAYVKGNGTEMIDPLEGNVTHGA